MQLHLITEELSRRGSEYGQKDTGWGQRATTLV